MMSRRHRKSLLGNLDILLRDLLPALHFGPLFSTLCNVQKALVALTYVGGRAWRTMGELLEKKVSYE